MRLSLLCVILASLIVSANRAARAQLPPERFRRRTADFLFAKGYTSDTRRLPDYMRIVSTRLPADVPGIGQGNSRMYVGIERSCPDSLKSRFPKCTRIDMVEIYAGGSDSALQGMVPVTYVGTRQGALFEVPASPEAQGDAALAGRAMHRAVLGGYIPTGPGLPPIESSADSTH
jgi:hypothetical protein